MKKIIVERDKCMGCGTCAIVCPTFFKMDEDGRSTIKEGKVEGDGVEKEIDNIGCAEEAAQGCPVQCITIKEE